MALCHLENPPHAHPSTRNLSSPLWHRDELSAVEPGTLAHDHARSLVPLIPGRPGTGAPQPLAMAHLPGSTTTNAATPKGMPTHAPTSFQGYAPCLRSYIVYMRQPISLHTRYLGTGRLESTGIIKTDLQAIFERQ